MHRHLPCITNRFFGTFEGPGVATWAEKAQSEQSSSFECAQAETKAALEQAGQLRQELENVKRENELASMQSGSVMATVQVVYFIFPVIVCLNGCCRHECNL